MARQVVSAGVALLVLFAAYTVAVPCKCVCVEEAHHRCPSTTHAHALCPHLQTPPDLSFVQAAVAQHQGASSSSVAGTAEVQWMSHRVGLKTDDSTLEREEEAMSSTGFSAKEAEVQQPTTWRCNSRISHRSLARPHLLVLALSCWRRTLRSLSSRPRLAA